MTLKKVALVTGAGSGIGKLTAIALMKAGFHVVLAGRRAEQLQEVAVEAEALGVTALAVPTDITDPASVDVLFVRIVEVYGRLDVLFNNAGTNTPAVDLDELTFENWKMVLDTNLTGSFLCAQGAFRLMKAQSPQGGRIINNGSISADAPRPNSVPYTTSKHAITGLTKCIALDGRRYDIACGQIDIGNADTKMGGRMKAGVIQANGEVRPEPVMDAQHVADTVVTMATLPLDVNILSLTIMATKMPLVGRG